MFQNWGKRLTPGSNGTEVIRKQGSGAGDVGTQVSIEMNGANCGRCRRLGSCVFLFSNALLRMWKN